MDDAMKLTARIEEIETKIAAMQRAYIPPIMGSSRPVIMGRVIDSGGGEVRIVVDRETADYPAVNERVVLVERSHGASLLGLAPVIGSIWHWEPMKSHASQRVIVTDVNIAPDGEVRVESGPPMGLSRGVMPKARCWNTLSRWMEAAVLVEPAEGEG